jgi:hypothetical protein
MKRYLQLKQLQKKLHLWLREHPQEEMPAQLALEQEKVAQAVA